MVLNDVPLVANFPLVAGFGNPQCMFICYMLIFLYAYDVISISSSLVSWIRKSIPLKKNTRFKSDLHDFFGLDFFLNNQSGSKRKKARQKVGVSRKTSEVFVVGKKPPPTKVTVTV